MQEIMKNVGTVFTNRSLLWKQQITAKLLVKGLGHQIVARSDELIIARCATSRTLPDACYVHVRWRCEI
jgi:hypothetical protein